MMWVGVPLGSVLEMNISFNSFVNVDVSEI